MTVLLIVGLHVKVSYNLFNILFSHWLILRDIIFKNSILNIFLGTEQIFGSIYFLQIIDTLLSWGSTYMFH